MYAVMTKEQELQAKLDKAIAIIVGAAERSGAELIDWCNKGLAELNVKQGASIDDIIGCAPKGNIAMSINHLKDDDIAYYDDELAASVGL